jgi:hypothetical protein
LLYAGTDLQLNLTIYDTVGNLRPLDSVKVVIRNTSNRFEKDATVTGDGTCIVTLTALETAESGNYHVQPIVTSSGVQVPGQPKTFELQSTL